MITIEHRSGWNIQCCATCRIWRAGDPRAGEPNGEYCPETGKLPPGDLKLWGCPRWEQEVHDSWAVEQAEEIERRRQ